MDIKVNAVRFDADKKLVTFINKKVEKLDLFFDGIVLAEVFLRIENVQDEENKLVEIRLSIAGNDLFVKKQSNTFEDAVSQSVESLSRQLTRYKEKLRGA